jgi:hypothetical protein
LFSTGFDIAVSIFVLLATVDHFLVVGDLPVVEELRSSRAYVELLFDAFGIDCLELFDG